MNDIETAEWVSRHFGEITVLAQQVKEGKTLSEGNDLSYSEQRQKLMTPEQIMGMKADDLLLLVSNHNPLKAKQN
ncbi:type IV secretory system conjugative DNA transfer family protein, partial [Ochrobactrum sp. SFR4]|uniref:type IV secretory system conjugative DNA transfer family protein n=1 Tax=Ochrobactrum sp. SFR4 TaxID=2717368 RepID=UPI00256FC393